MKTTIYIDGFNLYYSAIRGTEYKWLDVVALFRGICQQQNPESEITQVKFFTAPIKAKLSTRQQQALYSQQLYIKALETLHPDHFECIEGFFQLSKGNFPRYQTPIDKLDKVPVWKVEEKKTDVNIALSMYRDASKETAEQVVIVTSDSDIIPALEYIREDFPEIKIGVVFPKIQSEADEYRISNKALSKLSHWTRGHIHPEELEASQLPDKIPTKKKPIIKPNYW